MPRIIATTRLRHALNLQGRRVQLLVALVAALLLPLAGGVPLREALRYDRAAIASGEFWRLATGHFVHLDAAHAGLNAAGLCLLWVLFADAGGWRAWLLAALLSLVAMDLGFWCLQPDLAWYVGASGLLHGIMAAGTFALLRGKYRLAPAMAALFVAKLAWEQGIGALPFETRGTVIVAAHLYGALGGIVAGCLPRPLRVAIMPTTLWQEER